MEKIIAVDPGKFDIKAATGNLSEPITSCYRSKLYTLKENEHFEAQGASKFISYGGNKYIIGAQGAGSDKSLKKDTILHKVGLMASLSDLVSEGDSVRLILGCPASIYRDKESRKNYKNFMTDNGILTFETDMKKFDVTIASTLVLPEASGAPYVYPSIFKDTRVAVVDMGGLNLNFAVFNNLVLDLNSMNTINHGGYELENRVKNRFSGKYGVVLSSDDYEQIVTNNGLVLNDVLVPESTSVLENVYSEFVSEIPNIIKGFDYDISLMKVVCIGGTSKLLREQIKRTIPHAIIQENSTWANVLGFLKLGQLKYGA